MKAILILALAATPALAQPAPTPVCVRQEILKGFEGWGRGPAAAGLAIDRPASLKLMPVESVSFAMPLARPATSGTFGGTFPLHVAKAAEYRIALSAGAWIDVVERGKPIASTSHMKGPACSGIAKVVTFALAPGDYVVQLSEAKADGILVMVAQGSGA